MTPKPKVSLICAAARSQSLTQTVCDAWHEMNPEVDVEFVVPSPGFKINNAVNFRDDMLGCSHANAQGYGYCTGDFIGWISDETMPTDGNLTRMVEFLKNERRPCMAEFVLNMVEEPWAKTKNFYVCGRQYVRFGLASRKTLRATKGFFDPAYHAHWVDSDLSLRCWEAGGICTTCWDSVINCISYTDKLYLDNSKNYFDLDFKHFLSRWQNKYPQMRDPNWRSWNTYQEFANVGN